MSQKDLRVCQQLHLRDHFKNEARNFTPWLARNIGRLGEALGLELENVHREKRVGTFHADLVCKLRGSNSTVVI